MSEVNDVISKAAAKAHPVFTLFGWKYYDGAPSLERLETVIADLLKSAIADEEGFMQASSGRFTVSKSSDETGVDYRVMLNLGVLYDYEDKNETV